MSSITQVKRTVNLSDAARNIKDRLGSLTAAETAYKSIIRIAVEIDSGVSPVDWLRSSLSDSKIYWTDRTNSFEMAGVGECLVFEAESMEQSNSTINSAIEILRQSDDEVRIFGGIRFPTFGANGQSEDWSEFKYCRFILPRFEIVRQNGSANLICNVKSEELDDFLRLNNEIDSINLKIDSPLPGHSEIVSRLDEPTYDGWSGNIKTIIDDFTNGKVEKIVLARQTSFQFKDNCDALALLERLNRSTLHCYHYYFQPKQNIAFLGASPEQLYARRNRQIASEALAGTRPRGETADQDLKLGDELLHNEKELREHNYVVNNIKTALYKICEHYSENNKTQLLKLNRVQHLQTRFSGTLKSGIGDANIISELHPTSAVGGYPSDTARERIAQCEHFDRGWYAGALGWLSKDSAEFAVAIRSGLVRQNVLKLFSGAGIVKGSTPESEWAEIESKIGSFLSAVTG